MQLLRICLILSLLKDGDTQKPLISVKQTRQFSSEKCCADRHLLVCQEAMVDPSLLISQEDVLLPGAVAVSFKNLVEPNGYHYGNSDGDEVTITYNLLSGNMFGVLTTADGKSFAIEKCRKGHFWKKFDVSRFVQEEGLDIITEEQLPMKIDISSQDSFDRAASDNDTKITYSVMFYYTTDFEEITEDIEGFIDQVVAETNQGYINSKVPLEVTKFCVEKATIEENSNHAEMIDAFKVMKGSGLAGATALRNTADAAALLVKNSSSCGVAYMNQISSGYTISVCMKSCAIGYYSFGHEVGHNMGLAHNPEQTSNPYYTYGHGHLIEQGSASRGYRTILAYTATNHGTRVNYYSNPGVTYSQTGKSTGKQAISNNAAVLLENRFKMAAIGDESDACKVSPAPPSTPPSPSRPQGCYGGGCESMLGTCKEGSCIFPFIFKGQVINSCTTIDGDSQAWCATEVTLNSTMTSWAYCSTECPGMGYPDCRQGDTIPMMKVFKTFRRMRTVRDCVEKCLAVTDCEYYKWKNHRKWQRRTCWLMKTMLITKKNFTSGPKYCNAE